MEDLALTISLFIHYATPSSLFSVLTLIVATFLFLRKFRGEALVVISAYVLTVLTVTLLKLAFAVPRSTEALVEVSTYAFPSAHAAASAYFIVIGIWLLTRLRFSPAWYRILAILIVFFGTLVMYSRIVILVHTPFQVLIGALVGLTISLGMIEALQQFSKRSGIFR